MAKKTIAQIIADEIEAAYRAGIMACLVNYCRIDSAKADRVVDQIMAAPNNLAGRQRTAKDRIASAFLATAVDINSVERRQMGLW